MKMVNLFDEVEIISRASQSVLTGGDGGGDGGSAGGSSEEEDPPWINPWGNYVPARGGG